MSKSDQIDTLLKTAIDCLTRVRALTVDHYSVHTESLVDRIVQILAACKSSDGLHYKEIAQRVRGNTKSVCTTLNRLTKKKKIVSKGDGFYSFDLIDVDTRNRSDDSTEKPAGWLEPERKTESDGSKADSRGRDQDPDPRPRPTVIRGGSDDDYSPKADRMPTLAELRAEVEGTPFKNALEKRLLEEKYGVGGAWDKAIKLRAAEQGVPYDPTAYDRKQDGRKSSVPTIDIT